jgi:hypothetical protein
MTLNDLFEEQKILKKTYDRMSKKNLDFLHAEYLCRQRIEALKIVYGFLDDYKRLKIKTGCKEESEFIKELSQFMNGGLKNEKRQNKI